MAQTLLSKCPKLETMICGCATIKGNVDAAPASRLESTSLKHLDLSGIYQDAESGSSLMQILRVSYLPSLKALILNNNKLIADDLIGLLTSTALASVELLSLQSNKIGALPAIQQMTYSEIFDEKMNPLYMRLKILDLRSNMCKKVKPSLAFFLEETIVLLGEFADDDCDLAVVDDEKMQPEFKE